MPTLTPAKLRSIFAKADLRSVGALVARSAAPAAAIARRPADDASLKKGRSKLGGAPDLPPGAEWPVREDGAPLAFLIQINLAEVAKSLPRGFPRTGLLSFFYDVQDQPWGFAPEHADGFRILYAPSPKGLERVTPPEGAAGDVDAFTACSLRWKPTTTFSEPDYDDYRDHELASEALDLLRATLYKGQGDDRAPLHRLGGHPVMLQSPMEEQCALVTGGDLTKSQNAKAARLRKHAKDWTLLLQLDSDDTAGWMWGDLGVLTFWIRKQDLKARRFDRCWCVLQCG